MKLAFMHSQVHPYPMIFINYREIAIVGTCVALIALGIWAFRAVRSFKNALAKWSLRLLALGVVLCGALPLLLFAFFSSFTQTTNSETIFSPDHQHAFRVYDEDAGALGGGTTVSISGYHGLRNAIVLTGTWKAVEAEDIHWLSDEELLIEYPLYPDGNRPTCNDFGRIRVTCRPIPTAYLPAAIH